MAYAVGGEPAAQKRQTMPHGLSKRVVLAFTVIGALAGAGGVAALVADYDPNPDGVVTAARAGSAT